MKVLVAGGAGFIGSHMAKLLVEDRYEVVVLDDLSTGHGFLAKYGHLVIGSLGDAKLLRELFSQHQFDAVMHFAASSLVAESVVDPAKYFHNNISNTLVLLDVMREYGCHHFVFSSTAATFGEPEYVPIDEKHPQTPVNPYGLSKLMVEQILREYAHAYELNSVCLRYFNAAGADPECELGESHSPETHLIPIILQTANGKRDNITVFGRDYNTDDGTCIRDYVHVNDLCQAHMLALQKLINSDLKGFNAFNLGNGNGHSVAEVVAVARRIVTETGHDFVVTEGARRRGDPAILVADSTLATTTLGWQPKYPDLEEIIRHAWAWELSLGSTVK